MTALLIETATEICSVAVWRDGVALSAKSASEPFRHAAMLNVYIQEALEAASVETTELEVIGLSEGPGSYTSLRVGAAMAKGIAFALPAIRLYPLSSLRALARSAYARGWSGPLISSQGSRRDEVYACWYAHENDLKQEDIRPVAISVHDPALKAFVAGQEKVHICGSGSLKIADALASPAMVLHEEHLPTAAYLGPELEAALTANRQAADVASFEPLYLKPPFVTVPKKRSLL